MSGSIPAGARVWTNARLFACDSAPGSSANDLGLHAIAVLDGRISAVLPMGELRDRVCGAEVVDTGGAWVTPGFVDCHTHLVYAGNRASEIEARLRGASYAEIAREGGGILSTVRATRAASESELVNASLPRLRALAAEGVTTVEIKSGYGLTLNDELKMLRAARSLAERLPVNVRTTLLAAHLVPPEYAGRTDEYVREVCEMIIPAAAGEGLVDAVDVFCEHIAFTPAHCEQVFAAARRHGLPVKAHAEQLSNSGGALLAARFRALSADHLEYLDETGIAALAQSGTVAVLLPGAAYSLREPRRPPIAMLRTAGVPMAVATDLNPGTSPFASLRLMLNLACTLFGLTPQEALAGVTRHAARALGMAGQLGTLTPGMQADFLVWDIEHPAELVCELGVNRLRQRVYKGGPSP